MSREPGSSVPAKSKSKTRPTSEPLLPEISHPKKRAFLTLFPSTGTVTHTAKAVGIDRRTHTNWLRDDPLYAATFHEQVVPARNDALIREATRRAIEGVKKPVYQGKELVGYVQEYSDTLLIFLMKGAMPETYRERVEQTSTVRHEPTVDLTKLTDAELTQWAALAEKAMPGPARAALPAPKEGNNILD